MFIFGQGKNSKTWSLPNNLQYNAILCEYTYFNIFFFFQIALSRKWSLIGENRSDDKKVKYAEIKSLLPEKTPKLNLWEAYGLLITIISYTIFAIIQINFFS